MLVNQKIVSNTKNKSEWLIVDICEDVGLIAVSDLLSKSPKRPFTVEIEEVNNNVKRGRWHYEEHDFPQLFFVKDKQLDSKWIQKREDSLKTINPVLNDPDLLHNYLYGNADGILNRLIRESGRSKKYVSSRINRYFQFGGFENSLLPKYFKCGSNHRLPDAPVTLDDGTFCLQSKTGPETRHGEPYRGVTKEDITNIKKFSKKIKSGSEVNLEELYLEFCMEYLSAEIRPFGAEDEDIAEPLKVRLPRRFLISSKSFKRQLKKYVDELTFLRKKVGSINYARDHAGKPGLARAGLRGPTSRYEIDSTTADLYIRYPYSTDELLSTGRPTIYIVTDTHSSMIVGVHVTFGAPNWHGASQALFNAFSNKVEFCKQFGLEISDKDWPCQEVCRELTLDRGSENTDSNIKALLKGQIGISVGNFNAYHRGDAKGTVEKLFHILQIQAIPFEAGKVLKVPRKEDQHASRRPLYTYEQFIKKLIKHIIFTNNNRERVISHNFEMSRDDVEFTPRGAWNWGLEHSVIRKQISKDRLRFALLPTDTATVHDKGVYFKGLYYSSKEIARKLWLDRAKNLGRFKIEIRYTDISTNHIWCKDEETGEILQLDLTDRSEAYRNQIWANVMHRLEAVKNKLAVQDESRFSNRVELEMEMQACDDEIRNQIQHLKKSTSKGIQLGMHENKQLEEKHQHFNDMETMTSDLSQSSDSESGQQNSTQSTSPKQNLSDPTIIAVDDED